MRVLRFAIFVHMVGLLLALSVGSGHAEKVKAEDNDSIPPPDSFVLVKFQPTPDKLVQPKYPKEAQKLGIEGTVYVKVFVDEKGKVRKAIILKSSGKNVGFDEAALKSAKKGKWHPAKDENGKKVGVWVAYPIKFSLKH